MTKFQTDKTRVDELLEHLCSFSGKIRGDGDRYELKALAFELLAACETSTETVLRLAYQPQQNATLKVAVDLGIFKLLANAWGYEVTAADIALETRADVLLIIRVMRVLVASGLCQQVAAEAYIATEKTIAFASPTGDVGTKCLFELAMPTAVGLPGFLKATGYRNPSGSGSSPMKAIVGDSQFEWMKKNPKAEQMFAEYMCSRRAGLPHWFHVYPIDNIFQDFNNKHGSTVLVDVGGCKGHDLSKFLEDYPGTGGQLVLQDQEAVLPKELPGVLVQAYDFFTPQLVRGSRAYSFHSIFHDWDDLACRQILSNTIPAMIPGYSKIIIVDFVLPATNALLFPTLVDINMMALSSGMERSEIQWRALLTSVGLKVTGIWHGQPGTESVIEAMAEDEKEDYVSAEPNGTFEDNKGFDAADN